MNRYLIATTLSVFAVASALAANLKIVDVTAPNINCVFNPACTVVVSDIATHFTIPGTAGSGFLQSRNYRGEPGTPAAGFTAYVYRIDTTDITNTVMTNSGITSLTVDFHHLVRNLDYNGDTNKDDVFVITKGGLGSVGPKTAVLNPAKTKITFNFNPPILYGKTSYFFGVCSSNTPTTAIAQVKAINALIPPGPLTLSLTNSSPAP